MVWTDLALTGASREQLEEAEQKYPLKRYGQPEDVAYLAVYMLSDASSWMTGSSVDITGGGEGIIA
jgi:NAD(P)-dependent dehydrogenase (short-subunit alcohol dehydrogenase family)